MKSIVTLAVIVIAFAAAGCAHKEETKKCCADKAGAGKSKTDQCCKKK